MHETGQLKPIRVSVTPNCFRGLKAVVNLAEIGVWIAVVDQCVQILKCRPNAHAPMVKPEILLLFRLHKSARLVCVVEPVERVNSCRSGFVRPEILDLFV